MTTTSRALGPRLREAIARHADEGRLALRTDAGPTSYAELGDLVDRVAGVFGDVEPGTRVGITASRSTESVALFLGVMQAGGCPCFLEPSLGSDERQRRLQALEIHRIARTDDVGSAARAVVTPVAAPVSPDDLAMMQSTSGSTGQPKGVLLTHANLLANAEGIIERTGLTSDDRLLHLMPLHHTNGVNNQLVAPVLAGATVVLADRFRPERVESQIAEHGITYVTGVPTMYSRMLPHLHDPGRRRTLRFLRCGSAPLSVRLHTSIETAFGVSLVVSYGLSEATCTSTMNPPEARRIGSIGTVLPGQDVRLFVPGTTEEVACGDEGEICISGPTVMRGYVGPGAEQPIRDGWLRSGDLGRFDADGYLFFTGRLKDVIVRGGENLSPQLIENTLGEHPSVQACCVVGAPHVDLGEVPMAFVVTGGGTRPDVDELIAFVRTKLSRRYTPVEIRFVGSLPQTAMGKLDRQTLRARLR